MGDDPVAQRRAALAESYVPARGLRVLVTGGSTGIGLAVAEELAALGCRVMTCARRADALAALEARAAAKGEWIAGVAADLATPAGRAAVVDAVDATFAGRLDVLINNVGTNIRKPTVEFTDADFGALIGVNVEAAFALCRLLHPMLKAAAAAGGGGFAPGGTPSRVLFNSSVAGGPTAMKSGSIYAMTKAALNQLAKNLACEWARDGIATASVAPWYTNTPLARQVLCDPAFEAAVLSRTPAGRVAEVADVVRVFVWLCSPAARFVTGQTLAVDGGYSVMGALY